MKLHRSLAVVAVAAAAAACSSSPKPAPAAAPVRHAPAATTAPAAVPVVATLSSCHTVDPGALDTAVPNAHWTAAAPKLSGGTCVSDVSGGSGDTVEVTFSPTGAAAASVTSFRATPPHLPGATVLDDLGVAKQSAGLYTTRTGTSTYLLVLAEPTYAVSVQAELSALTQGANDPASTAKAIAAWAVSQQP